MCGQLLDEKVPAAAHGQKAGPGDWIFIEQCEIRRTTTDGLEHSQDAHHERAALVIGRQRRQQFRQQQLQATHRHRIEASHRGAVAKIHQQPRYVRRVAQTTRLQQLTQTLGRRGLLPQCGQSGVGPRGSDCLAYPVALADRCEDQSIEFPLHPIEVVLQLMHEIRPARLTHRSRQFPLRELIDRQRVGLCVAQHLQAVLERTQISVGGIELLHDLRSKQLAAAQLGQDFE